MFFFFKRNILGAYKASLSFFIRLNSPPPCLAPSTPAICSDPLFKLLWSFPEISITDKDVIFFCLIDLQRLFEGCVRPMASSQSYASSSPSLQHEVPPNYLQYRPSHSWDLNSELFQKFRIFHLECIFGRYYWLTAVLLIKSRIW